MLAHHLKLCSIQWARLPQDLQRHQHLAHIVQQGGGPQLHKLRLPQLHVPAQLQGQDTDIERMDERVLIHVLEGCEVVHEGPIPSTFSTISETASRTPLVSIRCPVLAPMAAPRSTSRAAVWTNPPVSPLAFRLPLDDNVLDPSQLQRPVHPTFGFELRRVGDQHQQEVRHFLQRHPTPEQDGLDPPTMAGAEQVANGGVRGKERHLLDDDIAADEANGERGRSAR